MKNDSLGEKRNMKIQILFSSYMYKTITVWESLKNFLQHCGSRLTGEPVAITFVPPLTKKYIPDVF